MEIEHHRDLAHEFPELKDRIHELKLASARFRALYEEYQAVDDEIHRIEQDIETPSDNYTEELKTRRVRLKDRLYGMLAGRIPIEPGSQKYVADGIEARAAGQGCPGCGFTRRKFRLPVDHGEVVRDWVQRGFSGGAFTDPPGHERRDVAHKTNELVAVVEGRLEIALHDERYLLEPGDELFIPRGAKHTVRNVHADATRWLYGYD